MSDAREYLGAITVMLGKVAAELEDTTKQRDALRSALGSIANYYVDPDTTVGACITLQAMAEHALATLEDEQ